MTRTASQAASLSNGLRAAGAEVIEAPLIALRPLPRSRAVRQAFDALDTYDYLLFTSANAVRAFGDAARNLSARLPSGRGRPAVVAVGPATAAAAGEIGMRSTELPRKFTAAAVAEMLEARGLDGKRILLPRAEVAARELPERLRRVGAEVDVLPMYRTMPHPDAPRTLPPLIRSGLDMVTFTSASTVKSFAGAAGEGFRRPPGLRIACIGPVTADAARRAGLDPDVVAAEHTATGMVTAIRDYFAGSAP